jgi:hypothetical protein
VRLTKKYILEEIKLMNEESTLKEIPVYENWLGNILNHLESQETENTIEYSYRDIWYFTYYKNSGNLDISYYDVWSKLKDGYGLNNNEIKYLMKEKFKNILNLNVNTIIYTLTNK